MPVPIFDGPWRLLSDDGHTRRWIRQDPDEADKWIVKTQTYITSAVAEDNAEHLKASEGKRFGDGQMVARIPLNLLYGKLREPWLENDRKWMRRYLNDPDNRWLRTFKGHL